MVGGGRGLAGLIYLTPSSGGFLTLNISLAKLQQLNITSALRVVVHLIPVICENPGRCCPRRAKCRRVDVTVADGPDTTQTTTENFKPNLRE